MLAKHTIYVVQHSLNVNDSKFLSAYKILHHVVSSTKRQKLNFLEQL